MCPLPDDVIENIASFLTLYDQAKVLPESLKKLENKMKIIRRAVFNWRFDYLEWGWRKYGKNDLKRFIPIIFRNQLVETIKKNNQHALNRLAISGAEFAEIVDQLDDIQCVVMLIQAHRIKKLQKA